MFDKQPLAQAGFTLMELMVAVTIIGILVAFLVPSMSTYMRRAEGQSAARDVANALRMARNQAMSRGEVVLARITTYQDGSSSNGKVELLRTVDTSDNAVRATSCVEANSLNTSVVHTIDVGTISPDMLLLKIDPAPSSGNSRTICFSPGGKALSTAGLPLYSDDADCESDNLRVMMRQKVEGTTSQNTLLVNPLPDSPDLDACIQVLNDDGTINAENKTKAQLQKDGRDLANFWMIHVPYNGAVDMKQ